MESFCYLGSQIQPNGSCTEDIGQRIRKAFVAFNSLNRCLWSANIDSCIKLRVYLVAIRPILLYGAETWSGTDSSLLERIDRAERRLLRRLLGYFYPVRPSSEEIYREVDQLQYRLTHGRVSRFLQASQAIEQARLRFVGHLLRRPQQRLARQVLYLHPKGDWKRRPGAPRTLWSQCVRDQLRMPANAFGRDPDMRRIWASPVWMDILSGVAADRTLWNSVVHGKVSAVEALKRQA